TFYKLKTIDFPHSFPIDTMHLIFENIVPSLFQWWRGSYLNKNDDHDIDSDEASNLDDEVDALQIPKAIWKRIKHEMQISHKTILTAYGWLFAILTPITGLSKLKNGVYFSLNILLSFSVVLGVLNT